MAGQEELLEESLGLINQATATVNNFARGAMGTLTVRREELRDFIIIILNTLGALARIVRADREIVEDRYRKKRR
jgi:hypothetical protein